LNGDPIPSYQQLMNRVLKSASQGPRKIAEVVEEISDDLDLSDADRSRLLPSGKQTVIANRVHWARSYLKQAGLLQNPKRGWFELTEMGREVLNSGDTVDAKYLEKFEQFQEFRSRGSASEDSGDGDDLAESPDTPDEDIQEALKRRDRLLASELLTTLRNVSPAFFEQVIVDLFVAMGYGGSHAQAARTLGQSGDRGVDGVIDQDALGLDQIYLQAKRYDASVAVGPADIRDFFGALSLRKAHKGIFVTTSSFTSSAKQTAADLGSRIVLVDGSELVRLMIRYQVGVTTKDTLRLLELDENYFLND
jgi:restriction system protein